MSETTDDSAAPEPDRPRGDADPTSRDARGRCRGRASRAAPGSTPSDSARRHRRSRRSRLTVLLRLPLAVPHFIWLYLWSSLRRLAVLWSPGSSGCSSGRIPGPLHRFLACLYALQRHLTAFIDIAANPFPGFTGNAALPGRPRDRAGGEAATASGFCSGSCWRFPRSSSPTSFRSSLYMIAIVAWFAALFTGNDRRRRSATSSPSASGTWRRRTPTSSSSPGGTRASRTPDRVRVEAIDYHTGGEPFRILTGGVPPLEGARSSSGGASRSSTSTRFAGSSSSSRAATPTCTAVTSSRRTTTARISGSSSSTTPATRPPAGTGRSRSSRGRSTRAWWSGSRARTASSSTCPRAGSRRARRSRTGASVSVRFRNVPSYVEARGLEAAGRTVDVAFGGAFYASVPERVEPSELPRLIELGRQIKRELEAASEYRPPARARAPRHLRRDVLAGGG